MLAKGLRSHSLYNYAGYILPYIKTVHKPSNIPVQLDDECRLLINTTVVIDHCSLKEILLHCLYNSWKVFSLLYNPSTVHPLCLDAAYDSCGAYSCASHDDHHPRGKPYSLVQCWLTCRPCYKKRLFSCERNQPFEENVSYHLGWLSVTARALVPSKAPFFNPSLSCRTPYCPTYWHIRHISAGRQC